MSSFGIQYGYLNFQGRGQIGRLLLAYTKTPFTEKLYFFMKIAEWVQEKETLGLDFPSMPYLIDGKFKITESRAIEKYILHRAKRTDLMGRNNQERAFIDNIDGVLRDIFSEVIGLLSVPDFDEGRKKLFNTVEPKLNYLELCIGQKSHLLSRLTYVDFVLNVVFGYFRLFFPHEYSRWANIERVFQTVNNLPQVAKYYSSPEGISALLPSEWSSNPKFINIKPLKESVIDEKLQPQSVVKIYVEELASVTSSQESQNILNSISEVPVLKQTESISEPKINEAPVIRKIESVEEPKQFTSRVSEYMKAVELTNQKSSTQNKQGLATSIIVTPSKLDASLKSSASGPFWKVNNQKVQEKKEEPSSIVLGYWGIRGLAQVQRHLLTYCGHEFTQKLYKTREEWVNGDKITLNLPFPNLPYLTLGSFKLTESLAIDRYIIRTSGKQQLLGKNLKDETYIENTVKILSELFADIRVLCFTEEQEKKKAEVLGKIGVNFPKFQKLSNGQSYTFGYLSWVDFYVAEISYYIEKIFPEVYQSYGFLKRVRESVANNGEIEKYYSKADAVKGPFMPPSAKIFF